MSDQVPIIYWNSWKKIGRYFLLPLWCVKTLINYYNLINFWVFRKSHVNSSIPSLSCFVFMKTNFNPISVVISRKSHFNSTNVLLFPGKGMDEKIKDWREFSAGFLSGNVSVLVLYPIHKLMFRQVWKSVSEILIVRFLPFSFQFHFLFNSI
jgi:hypothetical protein